MRLYPIRKLLFAALALVLLLTACAPRRTLYVGGPVLTMDAHAADLNSLPIGDVRTVGDIVSRLQTQAEKSSGDWVLGLGYDDTRLAPEGHPTRQDLDRVSTTQPVAAIHVSGPPRGRQCSTSSPRTVVILRDAPSPR